MVDWLSGAPEAEAVWTSPEISLPKPYAWVLYKTEFYQAAGYYGGEERWYSSSGYPECVPVIGWRDLS